MTESSNPSRNAEGVIEAEPGSLDAPKPAEKAETKAQEPAKEPEPKAGGGDTDEAWRTKQEVAQLQRKLRDMSPYAQFGMAVAQDERGKGVVERWQKGKSLFTEEDSFTDSEHHPREQPVSKDDLNAILDAREAARRQMDELNDLAKDNLEHFSKMRRSQKYAKALSGALATVWNDPDWFEDAPDEVKGWDDENAARNYTAIKHAYKYVLATNPKVIEAAKEAGKKEAKEKAEAAMAASVSSGGTSSSQEEPPPKSAEEDMIERMVNAGQGGRKSFRTIARKS
jgi:hypothetical protein